MVTGETVTGEEVGLNPVAITIPPVRVTLVKLEGTALTAEEKERYGLTDAGAVLVLEPDGALRRQFDAVPPVNELRQALLNEDPEPPAAAGEEEDPGGE